MASSHGQAREAAPAAPSPLSGLLSSSSKLDLPNWNDKLSFAPALVPAHTPSKTAWRLGSAQRTPSGKAPGGLRTPGLNWGIRRVTQGATPSRTPALAGSRILQGTPHAGLVASSLQHLPNALDAEYWICKADVEEGQGHFEAAAELYQEALRRDVRPATAITRAYSEFRARMYAEHPVASFGLEADDGALLDVGNRPPVPSTTPRKLAINGKPMRVATPAAKRAPASAQKPFQRPASQGAAAAATVQILAPVRTPRRDVAALGADTVLTPVRRSLRNGLPAAQNLDQTQFAFAPNAALLGSDIPAAGAVQQGTCTRQAAAQPASPAAKRQSRVQFQTPNQAAPCLIGADSTPAVGGSFAADIAQSHAKQAGRRKSHVHFKTPESNVVAAAVMGSPEQRERCNSCDAGSTPFRPGRTGMMSPFADLPPSTSAADDMDDIDLADANTHPVGANLTAKLSAAEGRTQAEASSAAAAARAADGPAQQWRASSAAGGDSWAEKVLHKNRLAASSTGVGNAGSFLPDRMIRPSTEAVHSTPSRARARLADRIAAETPTAGDAPTVSPLPTSGTAEFSPLGHGALNWCISARPDITPKEGSRISPPAADAGSAGTSSTPATEALGTIETAQPAAGLVSTPAGALWGAAAAAQPSAATPAAAADLLIEAFAGFSFAKDTPASTAATPSTANAAESAVVTRFRRLDAPGWTGSAPAATPTAATAAAQASGTNQIATPAAATPAAPAETPVSPAAPEPAVATLAAAPVFMTGINPLFNSLPSTPSGSESGGSCFSFTPAALSAMHCLRTPASVSSIAQGLSHVALTPLGRLDLSLMAQARHATPATPAPPAAAKAAPADPASQAPAAATALAPCYAGAAAEAQQANPAAVNDDGPVQEDSFGSPFAAASTPQTATATPAARTLDDSPPLARSSRLSSASDLVSAGNPYDCGTPLSTVQQEGSLTPVAFAYNSGAYKMSPELLGFTELELRAAEHAATRGTAAPTLQPGCVGEAGTGADAEPSSPVMSVSRSMAANMPRSAFKGLMERQQATPSAGLLKPMRVQTPASRPRICRNEVKSLLESSFQPASEELGSTSLLSPVRANSRLRGQLGSQKMVTPVRRSTRGLTPAKPTIASILEETDFAYAPNDLLRRSTRPRSATPTSPDASDEATAAADSDDSASETAGGGPERSTPMAGSQLVAATLQAAGDASVPPQEHEFNELTNMMAELAVQQAELSAPSTKAAKGRRLMGKPAGTPKGGSLTPELTPKGSDSRRKSRSRVSMSTTEANIRAGLRRSTRLRNAEQKEG